MSLFHFQTPSNPAKPTTHISSAVHAVAARHLLRESWRARLTVKKAQHQLHVGNANPEKILLLTAPGHLMLLKLMRQLIAVLKMQKNYVNAQFMRQLMLDTRFTLLTKHIS